MTISIQLPILFRRTTDEQSIKFAMKFKEKRARTRNSVSATWWPGEMKSVLVYDTFEAHMTENAKAVFAKENSNLALIPHRLTSVL